MIERVIDAWRPAGLRAWCVAGVAAWAGGWLACASVASAHLSGTQLSIVAGTGSIGPLTPGPATGSDLFAPWGAAFDASTGDFYFADSGVDELAQVAPDGTLSVIAGTGTPGLATPGPATSSQLNDPLGIAVDRRTATCISPTRTTT